MALYQRITITDAGAELISGIILNGGTPLTFEAVAVGSGELAEGTNTAAFTELISEAKRLPIETVTQEGGIITVTARLATDTLTADLYHREVGIYANGILLAYGNTGDKYDYIPTAGNNAAVQKIIRVPLAIGTMQTAFAEMDTTDLVTHAALEARVGTVVEPIVREIVTPKIAEEALDEAVREIAKEVSQEAATDAYNAQIKAEQAAAEALVSETNVGMHTKNSAIHELVMNINELYPGAGSGENYDLYTAEQAVMFANQYMNIYGLTDTVKGGIKLKYKTTDGYYTERMWNGVGDITFVDSWLETLSRADLENSLFFEREQVEVYAKGFNRYASILGFSIIVADAGKLKSIAVYTSKTATNCTEPIYCHAWNCTYDGVFTHLASSLNSVTLENQKKTTWQFDGTVELTQYQTVFFMFTTSAEAGDTFAAYNGLEAKASLSLYNLTTEGDYLGTATAVSDGSPTLNTAILPHHFLGVVSTFQAHIDSVIHVTQGAKDTWNAKADWLDAKNQYQASYWRDSSGSEMSTNYLMCLAGTTARVHLFNKATAATGTKYYLLKSEVIFPQGTDSDITVTLDETNTSNQLSFDITTSASATAKNYLVRFEAVCLIAGTRPAYMSSLLRVQAAF